MLLGVAMERQGTRRQDMHKTGQYRTRMGTYCTWAEGDATTVSTETSEANPIADVLAELAERYGRMVVADREPLPFYMQDEQTTRARLNARNAATAALAVIELQEVARATYDQSEAAA